MVQLYSHSWLDLLALISSPSAFVATGGGWLGYSIFCIYIYSIYDSINKRRQAQYYTDITKKLSSQDYNKHKNINEPSGEFDPNMITSLAHYTLHMMHHLVCVLNQYLVVL